MNKSILYSLVFACSSAASFITFDKLNFEIEPDHAQQNGVQQTDLLKIEKLTPLIRSTNLTRIVIPEKVTVKVSNSKPISKPKPVSKPKLKPVESVTITPTKTPTKTVNTEYSAQPSVIKPITNDKVSQKLLDKFNKALLATENVEIDEPEDISAESAVAVYDLPERLLARVPDISYSSHVYSSTSANRSVRLNDRDLREGSWLTEDIEIIAILKNEVIMRVGPQSFSLKALSDWTG